MDISRESSVLKLVCSWEFSEFVEPSKFKIRGQAVILGHLPYSLGMSIRYYDRLPDFSVSIPRCYKGVYVNSFFPSTGRL